MIEIDIYLHKSTFQEGLSLETFFGYQGHILLTWLNFNTKLGK